MRFSHIREIYSSGDYCDYYSYEGYRVLKLATTRTISGVHAHNQLQQWFNSHDQIERQLETDFNLRRDSATGILLIIKEEGEVRNLFLDPNIISVFNHPRSSAALVMNPNWRFNYCKVTSPIATIRFWCSSQPLNFTAARG
jgi:hypothetical protein